MKIKDTGEQDTVIVTNNKHTKRIAFIATITAILIVIIWQITPAVGRWSHANDSVPISRVRLSTLTYADFTKDISVMGRVVAAVSPTIYSPADGTITLTIDAGTQVTQGQIIATLDSPELTSKLSQQQASLERLESSLARQKIQAKKQQLVDQKSVDLAQVKLTTSKREKRRADQGYNKSAISQIDFEKAQDDLENAKLQHSHAVQDAKLNLESLDFDRQSLSLDIHRQTLLVNELKRQVDALNIKTPVSGIVGNLNAQNKTFLSKNQAILTVVDLSHFEIEINIPESYADDLAIGMDVSVELDQQLYSAQLVKISPEIMNNQVTGRVRFSNETPKNLRQNQRLNAQIILAHKKNILQVRRGQFLESTGGRFAYKVAKGIAHKMPIVVGARSLSHVEIIDGLSAGDQIIISGTDMFNDAEQVLLTQ